jgi:Gpi18-like mannosyltransferase
VADRAVMLYCAFPGAMTFGILYSEPLAVALGAAALLALLERRWLLAGIIGAVATAGRPTMIILAVASGVGALQAIWDRREWRSLIAPLLTPLGVLAYFGYLGHRHHDYAYWFWIEKKGWHQHIDGGCTRCGFCCGSTRGRHATGSTSRCSSSRSPLLWPASP